MKTTQRADCEQGVTRAEVLATMVAVSLLAAAALTGVLCGQERDPARDRLMCVANLKQVGLALRMFSNDHMDRFPWAVSNHLGGTLTFAESREVFRHFQAISNELVSSKVLACPADMQRTRALSFAGLSNTNLSYFAGLDADEARPQRILSGDRTISTNGQMMSGLVRLAPDSPLTWAEGLHENAGNIGLSDGSVQQVRAPALQRQLQQNDTWPYRLVIP